MHYRYRETVYHINVLQMHENHGEMSVRVDGIDRPDKAILLIDDRKDHFVEVRISGGETDTIHKDTDLNRQINLGRTKR